MADRKKTTPAPEPTGTTRRAPAKSAPGAGLPPSAPPAAQPVTKEEGVTGGTARTSTPASASVPSPAPGAAGVSQAPEPGEQNRLTRSQRIVLEAILDADHTVTNADIAARTGVSERTIYRYWNLPHFRALHHEIVGRKIERAGNRRAESLLKIACDPTNRQAVAALRLSYQLEGKLVNMHAVLSEEEVDKTLARALGIPVEQLPPAQRLDGLQELWNATEDEDDGDGDGDEDGDPDDSDYSDSDSNRD